MQKTFTFYNDPGHGWVKVPKKVLKELGIDKEITSYSYQRGGDAFLEEDCDATLLINSLKARGIEPKFIDKYSDKDSKIRSYERYVSLNSAEQEELADLKLRMKKLNWSAKELRTIDKAGLSTLRYWQEMYHF